MCEATDQTFALKLTLFPWITDKKKHEWILMNRKIYEKAQMLHYKVGCLDSKTQTWTANSYGWASSSCVAVQCLFAHIWNFLNLFMFALDVFCAISMSFFKNYLYLYPVIFIFSSFSCDYAWFCIPLPLSLCNGLTDKQSLGLAH